MKVVAGVLVLLFAVACASSSRDAGYQQLPLSQTQRIQLEEPLPMGLGEEDLREIMLLISRIPGMNGHKVRFVSATEEYVTAFAQRLPGNGVPVTEANKTRKLDFKKEKEGGWVVTWVGEYLD